jgi:site-specific DNA-methyltransferase (adenine-specific)
MNKINTQTGNCLDILPTMDAGSVNCCVTSPPYFGLRDYGNDEQIGLEETPEAFVESMVNVFREVKRVLADDGTLWLNLGDSYAGSGKGSNPDGSVHPSSLEGKQGTHKGTTEGIKPIQKARDIGLKPKDLIGIPWRVALALQADGWYLRQDIIWSKPNPMPESVTDRCTKAHEYIFLLSKKPKYYYDADAIKDNAATKPHAPGNNKVDSMRNDADQMKKVWGADGMVNKRSVWEVTTKPFSGAHFATFPPDLIKPCILAGCPTGGTVLDPFGGSGTTGMVALELGRSAELIELNPDYVDIINERTHVTPGFQF